MAAVALFAPIMKIIKERLKECLKDKWIYADGLTPKQLADSMSLDYGVEYLFDNDLSR